MCFSSPQVPVDNTAAIARKADEERQGKITQGQSAIDNAFSGYNDAFYKKYQDDYTNNYAPQLTDQYNDARKRLTLQLAKTGNLTSSSGLDQNAKLKNFYDTRTTGMTNEAIQAANNLRANVDSNKSQLYADNRSAADPGNAAALAASSAAALQPGIPASPLANTFSDFFNNLGNATAIYNTNNGGGINTQGNGVTNYSGKTNRSAYNVG